MGYNRPRDVGAEADHTLAEYHRHLDAAELREQLDRDPSAPAPSMESNGGRLRNVATAWTVAILVIAAVALWFLDRVMATEIVAVLTAFVTAFSLARRSPNEPRPDTPSETGSQNLELAEGEGFEPPIGLHQ